MSRTVLVTGGAGFVGSALVRQLLVDGDPGDRIVVLDNFASGRREYVPANIRVEVVDADITDRVKIHEVCGRISAQIVIHLAAIHFIPTCNRHPDRCLKTNVVGTQNVLDALESSPPESLVIASSAAVYPICNGPCSEEAIVPEPTDVYGLSKWINEQQLRLFAARTGTRCAAARLFNVIGARETNPHVLPEIVDQMLAGVDALQLGNVEPKRDYIDSSDVAAALVAMALRNSSKFREFNVGTEQEYSVRELVARLAELTGRPLVIDTDQARVRKSDRMHLVSDCRRIQEELGWTARLGLEESLKQLWSWSVEKHVAPEHA